MSFEVIEGGNPGISNSNQVGSKGWADALRANTKKLAKAIDTDYLRLAEALWLIFDTPINGERKNNAWWREWGFGQIAEYEEKELGIHRRKAERLRRIWAVVGVQLAAMPKELKERIMTLGFSKVRELTRDGVLTMTNVEGWVSKAESMNCVTLADEVQSFLLGRIGVKKGTLGRVEPLDLDGEIAEADDDEPTIFKTTVAKVAEDTANELVYAAANKDVPQQPEKIFTKNFSLFTDQMDTVKAALERAAELSGSKKDGQNLSLICLDFLATNEFYTASMEQTQRFFARIEKALDVKLIVLTKKEHELLYGYKLLDRLTGEEAAPLVDAKVG